MTGDALLRIACLCVVLAGAETLHGIARTVLVVPRIGKQRALPLSALTGSALGGGYELALAEPARARQEQRPGAWLGDRHGHGRDGQVDFLFAEVGNHQVAARVELHRAAGADGDAVRVDADGRALRNPRRVGDERLQQPCAEWLLSEPAAQAMGARGVMAVLAGTVHSALDVRKVHSYRVDAFGSGDAGPIGYVEEGRLRLMREWPQGDADVAARRLAGILAAPDMPPVEIVMSHAGASGALVQALVAQGVCGIVVAATGNGTVHHALLAALLRARDAGVRVVRATRCAHGRVLETAADALPDSAGLSPVKARIALALQLMD